MKSLDKKALLRRTHIFSLSRTKIKNIVNISGKRGQISAQGENVSLNYNIKNLNRANLKISSLLIKLPSNSELVYNRIMPHIKIPQAVKEDTEGKKSFKTFDSVVINPYKDIELGSALVANEELINYRILHGRAMAKEAFENYQQ